MIHDLGIVVLGSNRQRAYRDTASWISAEDVCIDSRRVFIR
jgi:hypothetical protein